MRRPNGSDIVVRASEDDPFVAGLLLARPDSTTVVGATIDVTVPTVSGTSVTEEDVAALSALDEALELCYLLRQEVFIAEGRRMQDLGIKWPISQNEQLQNENVNEGDVFLEPIIPDFVLRDGVLDQFIWNQAIGEVTIAVNMNRVLVQNKASDLFSRTV